MKKILFVILLVLFLSGCSKQKVLQTDAQKFKIEYEVLNNQKDFHNNDARIINISEDNPIIYSSFKSILEKIENKDTFAVYFGFTNCPWCRSMIETMLKAAKENDINQLYYVDTYTERDTYELDETETPVKTKDAEVYYYELLGVLNDYLREYTLKDTKGNIIEVGEKRIYGPSVISFVKGKPVMIATNSPLQTDPYEELSTEIKDDMLRIYNELFLKIK